MEILKNIAKTEAEKTEAPKEEVPQKTEKEQIPDLVKDETATRNNKPSLIRSREDLEKKEFLKYSEWGRKKIIEKYGTTKWSQREAIRRQGEEEEKMRETYRRNYAPGVYRCEWSAKLGSYVPPGPPDDPPPGLGPMPLPAEPPEEEMARKKISENPVRMLQNRMRRLGGPPGIEPVRLQCLGVHRPRPIELVPHCEATP